jgi:beta-carotene hydroxylase
MGDGMGGRYYERHAGALKRDLAQALSRDRLRELHRKRPLRHFAVAGAQWVLLATATWALVQSRWPWLWPAAAVVQGFTVFNFTVLLHEVVHRTVVCGPSPRLYRFLGWLYSLPTGISASQFTRWHLDHHEGLGSDDEDPKRHRLSPKRNARWLKMLYFTPALFVIYFRAAAQETATYPPWLRRRVGYERRVGMALHLLAAAALAWLGGWAVLLRAYGIPVFGVFPVAFALNRLGQHYAIVPGDVAGWSTRMRPSRVWDAAYLWSAYHLEHHYFPAVPFYNLRRLSAELRPLLDRHGLPERTFGQLLWLYFVSNKAPHTDWGA